MDHPLLKRLESLPKETLIEVIKMYSRNWITVDGLWFGGVEEKYGMDAAVELDVRMWKIGSKIEAKRIKELFGFEGGIEAVLHTVDLMTWTLGFGYDYDISDDRAVWTCRRCPPQEQRAKLNKAEFPCRPTFEACFNNVIEVIDPKVKVECSFCPPGGHPDDAWCQWIFTLEK